MAQESESKLVPLQKAATGIKGFDEITAGGLPRGRPSLLCGGAGSGKTLFGMEFLVRGATEFDEPGVFISFEETEDDLAKNVASLGFDLEELQAEGKIALDYVYIERGEIELTGEYDLEALFIRLASAVQSVGAKRIVLDTLEALFSGLPNPFIVRAEIRRLFRWLKERGLTAVITAEAGQNSLTRHGIEEYVSDCVISLDHRVIDQVAVRRLRVVKYRGSLHGTNEYPFLIDEGGFTVVPITSLELDFDAPFDFVSTGIPRLDTMLGGKGFYRGSSVLVSGTAGTGKTSFAAALVDTACRRGETCFYFAFEESPRQIVRNMRSIGIDLEPWLLRGLLHIHAVRPTMYGLEMHLAVLHKFLDRYSPRFVVLDPISNLISIGSENEVKSTLTRTIDLLKGRQITSLFTNLVFGGKEIDQTQVGVSSLMDTWILLKDLETNGERNRLLHILKSRGMSHSKQVREFLLTDRGIDLVDVYVGPGGVLTGSARSAQEAREALENNERGLRVEQMRRELDRRKKEMELQMAILAAEYEAREIEFQQALARDAFLEESLERNREKMAELRGADAAGSRGERSGRTE